MYLLTYLTPGLVGGVDKGIGTVFTRSVRGGRLEDMVVALRRELGNLLLQSPPFIDINIKLLSLPLPDLMSLQR